MTVRARSDNQRLRFRLALTAGVGISLAVGGCSGGVPQRPRHPAVVGQGTGEALVMARPLPTGESLDDYVLKPLYSFAGLGVDMEPTREKLRALDKPHEWILQKKVTYAEFVPTVDGRKSKAEVRMMFVWPDNGEPVLVNNLVRMSQGKMMGVDFNKEKTWVGSNIALHAS